MDKVFLPRADLGLLYQALIDEGYQVVGPQQQDGAIIFDYLDDVRDLPWGAQEKVAPGSYQLVQSDEQRCFSWNTGPQAFKPFLFKPTQLLWTGQETSNGVIFQPVEPNAKPLAFLGVRSCDIPALYLQDKQNQTKSVQKTKRILLAW